MSTVPFPDLPVGLGAAIPTSVSVGLDINLIAVTQEALTASLRSLTNNNVEAARLLEAQIKPLFTKINSGIESYIKSRNLSEDQAAAFRKDLSKAIVAQVSGSARVNGFDLSFDDFLTNFDGKISIKFDRATLSTLPEASVAGVLALVADNVFGDTEQNDIAVAILRNGAAYSGALGVGDIRFGFSTTALAAGNFTPQIGFNVKLDKVQINKTRAFGEEFIVTTNANGSVTFEFSAKLEEALKSSFSGAPDIGKLSAGAGLKFTITLSDVFYINDFVNSNGTAGVFALKLKGTDGQEYYFTIPATALVAFGFTSSDLANVRDGIRSSSGAEIAIVSKKDKDIFGFSAFLPDSASIQGFEDVLDAGQQGVKGVNFLLQLLAARKLVATAGPVAAVVAFAPEIFEATYNIFRLITDPITANTYQDTISAQRDALAAFNEIKNVLRSNKVAVGQLDPEVLNDIATGLFIKEAAAKFPSAVAARLIGALVTSGLISLDSYFNAFNAGEGSDDTLDNYYKGRSTGDGTIGGAIAVLKNDPFARALNGLHRFQLGVDKVFDVKLLFGQQNQGEQQFILDELYKSGVDPFALAVATEVLYGAAEFRNQYSKDFARLNGEFEDFTTEYNFKRGVDIDITYKFFDAFRFARSIILNLTVDLNFSYADITYERLITENKIAGTDGDGNKIGFTYFKVRSGLDANSLWRAGITGLDDIPKLLDFIRSRSDPEEYTYRLRALARVLWEQYGIDRNFGREDLRGALDSAKTLYKRGLTTIGVGDYLSNYDKRKLNSDIFFGVGGGADVAFDPSAPGVLVASTDLFALTYDEGASLINAYSAETIAEYTFAVAVSDSGTSDELAQNLIDATIALLNAGSALVKLLEADLDAANRILLQFGKAPLSLDDPEGQRYLGLYYAALSSTERSPDETDEAFKARVTGTLVVAYFPGNEYIRDGLLKNLDDVRSGEINVYEYIKAELAKRASLAELRTALQEALEIARTSGNALGVILADIARLFVETQLAGLNGETRLARENGAIETGARLLGVTFSDFVKLLGYGDLAAFGAVLADAGALLSEVRGGSGNSTEFDAVAQGFALLGSALIATGRVGQDKSLIIVGTALGSLSDVLDGLLGSNRGNATAFSLGFGAASSIANVIGELSGSRAISSLGVLLAGIPNVTSLILNSNASLTALTSGASLNAFDASNISLPDLTGSVGVTNFEGSLFSDSDVGLFGVSTDNTAYQTNSPGGIRGDGVVAAAALASAFVGALIGGEAGARISAAGSLAQSIFRLVNLNGASPAGLVLAALQSLLTLIGVRLSPEVQFGLGALGTALTAGFATNPVTAPLAVALFGFQVITNFLRMGTFTRTSTLASDIDADRDGQADDNALLISEFRRNFFGSVKQTGSTIFYDVETVNPGLLREVQVSLERIRGEALFDQRFDDYDGAGNNSYRFESPWGTIFVSRLQGDSSSLDGGYPTFVVVQGAGELVEGRVLRANLVRRTDEPSSYIIQYDTNLYTANVLGNFNPINPGTQGGFETLANYYQYRDSVFLSESGNVTFGNLSTTPGSNVFDVSVGNGAGFVKRIITAAEAAQLSAELNIGIDGGIAFLGGQDYRLNSGTLLRNIANELDARFTQAKNDPNLYFYVDINLDGLPDLVRIGQTGPSFVVQGDGKVEITLLDAPGNRIEDPIIADTFAEAEQIAVLRTELYSWGASHPEIWKDGTDLISLYNSAKRLNVLNRIQSLHISTAFSFASLLTGTITEESLTGLSDTGDIARRLGLVFDANAYIDLYDDVASYSGGDPVLAAKHYIEYGNYELRAINAQGNILAPDWHNGPSSTTGNGNTTYYHTNNVGRLVWFDTYFASGNYQRDTIDTSDNHSWNWFTEIKDQAGRIISQRTIADDGNHTLKEFNYDPGKPWIRTISQLSAAREITSRETWYDVDNPASGGISRTVEEFDPDNTSNRLTAISYFDADNHIFSKREVFDNGRYSSTTYNYNPNLRYDRNAYTTVLVTETGAEETDPTVLVNTTEIGHENTLYRTFLGHRFEVFRTRQDTIYRPIVESVTERLGEIRERITGYFAGLQESRYADGIVFGDREPGGRIAPRIRDLLETIQQRLSENRELRAGANSPLSTILQTPILKFTAITDTYLVDGTWISRRLDLPGGDVFEFNSTNGASPHVPWTETLYDLNSDEVFSKITDYFNERGELYETIQYFDDSTTGTTTYLFRDLHNRRQYTNFTNLSGAIVRQTGVYENGNAWDRQWDNGFGNAGGSSFADIDVTDSNPNYQLRRTFFDANGIVYRETGVRDDGDAWDYALANNGRSYISKIEIDSNNDAVWSRQTSLYASDGKQVSELTQINDDGSKEVTSYDVTQTQTYVSVTNYYDTRNRIIRQYRLLDTGNAVEYLWPKGHGNVGAYSITRHDLKNLVSAYRTYTANYNSDNRLVKETFVRDDGQTDEYVLDPVTGKRTSWTELDTAGTQIWASRKSDYDSDGTVTTLTEIRDDGSKEVTSYDVTQTQTYVSVTNYYDTRNRIIRQYRLLDTGNAVEYLWPKGHGNVGAYSITRHDLKNLVSAYRTYTANYNSDNRLVKETFVRDDGQTDEYVLDPVTGKRTSWTELDTAGTQIWASRKSDYDSDGTVTTLTEIRDDGSKEVTSYDVTQTQTYVSVTNYYDTRNRIIRQYRLLDTGNAIEYIWPKGHGNVGAYSITTHDLKNLASAYRTYTANYNSDNRLVKQTFIRDDGQTDEYVLDPVTGKRTSWTEIDSNGSHIWASRRRNYNDLDQVTSLLETSDDGTTTTTYYDVAQAQPWTEYTNYATSAGLIIRQYRLLDTGNAIEYLWPNGHGNVGAYSITTHDLKNLVSTYRTYTANYNSDNKLVKQTFIRDNGQTDEYVLDPVTGKRTSWTEIDSNGSHIWASRRSNYAVNGTVVQQVDQINDDGTSTKTYYDVEGAPWAGAWYVNQTVAYDAAGNRTRSSGLRDNGNAWDYTYNPDGSQLRTEIDANNDEWYRSYTNTYDASGQKIVQQTGVLDNGDSWQWVWENGHGNAGSSERIDWDTSGTKPWWHEVADYNAANQLTRFETYYDDNTKVVDNYSNDANAGWTKRTDIFNAAGALSSQTYT